MLTNGGLRTCLRTREGEMHPKSGVGTESTRRFRGGSTQTPPSLAARKPALTAVGCLLTIALLGGCAFAPPRVPVARYTLAPVAVQTVAALPPLQVTVQAAPWLDSTTQHYRLLDDDPLRIRRYAQSQWADKPTALLLARLHAAGEGSRETSGQPLRVTLRLTDFTQTFTRTLESVGRGGMQPEGLSAMIRRHDKTAGLAPFTCLLEDAHAEIVSPCRRLRWSYPDRQRVGRRFAPCRIDHQSGHD